MADRLSQLQDAIDQMATQFFSALRYIAVIDDKTTFDGTSPPSPVELARDLIFKSKQIEFLITSLPGIGVSEDEQQERLKNLETELKEAEEERCRAVQEREAAAEKLDAVIRRLRRF
ncbi:hypothetical protein HOY82DRAFT_490984 [Tuber indicum]|nr:hypothetical protein HOY82DRAFT_490984 [Tuber indicum]